MIHVGGVTVVVPLCLCQMIRSTAQIVCYKYSIIMIDLIILVVSNFPLVDLFSVFSSWVCEIYFRFALLICTPKI